MKPKHRAVVFYVEEMLHDIITHHTAAQQTRPVSVKNHTNILLPIKVKFHYAIWFEPAPNQIA